MIQRASSASAARKHRSPDGPVRTCVGCRKRELAVELLRVVAVPDGELAVDTDTVLPGRGAWLHPDPQCLEQAIRRRAFTRALRITGSPDTSGLVEYWQSVLGHPATEQVERKHEHTVKSR